MRACARRLMVCALLSIAFVNSAHGQTMDLSEERSKRIKTAESVAPLGVNLFGDSTNFYDGQTTVTTTDIDLPGNSGLPVKLTRSYIARATEGGNRSVFAGWDIDVPYLTGNFAQNDGWKVAGS